MRSLKHLLDAEITGSTPTSVPLEDLKLERCRLWPHLCDLLPVVLGYDGGERCVFGTTGLTGVAGLSQLTRNHLSLSS